MSRLYNYDTKEWVNVDDSQVDDLVRSGKFVFESGIDVPVVDQYGELKYIKSDDAYNAFNQGYRWQTKEDQNVDFEKKSMAIRKEAADDPLLAGLTSATSAATLGGFDVGLRAAEEAGVLPEGVTQYRADLKTENPIASTVGSIGGGVAATLAAPIAGPLGAVGRGGQAASQIGAGLATTTVGKAALAGAVEGAYWGAGEGISEAALGKPEDVAANLLLHTGLGGLTGGVFGSAIGGVQAATPALRTAIDKVTDWGNEAMKSTARKLVKGTSTPVLRLTGKGEDADILRQLVDADPEFGRFVAEGGEKAAMDVVKEYRGALHNVKREQKDLQHKITALIKGSQKDEARVIREAIVDAKGDARTALSKVYEGLKQDYAKRDAAVADLLGQEPLFGTHLLDDLDTYIQPLQAGGSAAKGLGDEVLQKVRSYRDVGMYDAASELRMINEIRELVGPTVGKKTPFAGRDFDNAKALHQNMERILHGKKGYTVGGQARRVPENISAIYRDVTPKYAAYINLKPVIGTGSGMGKLFSNPALQEEIAPLLARLDEYAPELAALKAAGKDNTARRKALRDIEIKYNSFTKQGGFRSENIDDVQEIIGQLADAAGTSNMARLQEIRTALTDIETLSPFNAAMRIHNVLGIKHPDMDKLLKFEKEFAKLERLRGDGSENPIKTISSLLTRGGIGATLGGVPGAMIGAGSAMAASPYKTYKTLLQVQRMSDAGAKALKNAQKAMLDGLSGTKIRKGAAIVAPQTHSRDSIKQKREQFKRIQSALLDTAAPEKMAQMVEQMGGGVEGAPQLKMALAIKAQTAIQYLASQQPQDPLAGRMLNPLDSPFEPSDLDLAEYMRKVEIVNNPMLAFERVGSGEITLGEIEALKAVHPEVFSSLQNTVNTAIMEHGNRIPYQRRIMLGTIFQIPSDYSMDPALIAKMQEPYQPQDQGGRGKSGVNLDISPFDTVATETSKMTYGDMT